MKQLHRGTISVIRFTLVILVAFESIPMRSIAAPMGEPDSNTAIEAEVSNQASTEQPTEPQTITSTPVPKIAVPETVGAPTPVSTTTTTTTTTEVLPTSEIIITESLPPPTESNQPSTSSNPPEEATTTQSLSQPDQSDNAARSNEAVQSTTVPSDTTIQSTTETKTQVTERPEFNTTDDSRVLDLLESDQLATVLVDQQPSSIPTVDANLTKPVHKHDGHSNEFHKGTTQLVANFTKQPQQKQKIQSVLQAVAHADNVATAPSHRQFATITRMLFGLLVQAYLIH